jgi:hypothetical protein
MIDDWLPVIVIVIIVIGGMWFLSHSGFEENSNGKTYNYVCAYEAGKLADESKQIVDKMILMGCSGIVASDAVYAKCVELGAENELKIKAWKELSCTDDSRLP